MCWCILSNDIQWIFDIISIFDFTWYHPLPKRYPGSTLACQTTKGVPCSFKASHHFFEVYITLIHWVSSSFSTWIDLETAKLSCHDLLGSIFFGGCLTYWPRSQRSRPRKPHWSPWFRLHVYGDLNMLNWTNPDRDDLWTSHWKSLLVRRVFFGR